MILVITNKEDLTADYFIDKLQSREISYYRLNTEDIGTLVSIVFRTKSGSFTLIDQQKQREIDSQSVKSVYFRRPKFPDVPDSLSIGEKQFFYSEMSTFLEGLYRALGSKKWINNFFDIKAAENKIYQVRTASLLEFRIPDSLITNLPKAALGFTSQPDDHILKPLKSGLLSEVSPQMSRVIYTTQINQDFYQHIDDICCLPVYLQKKIKKEIDVRVTVVGDKVFAASIHSQESEISQTDWRRAATLLPHTRINLPHNIINRCLNLCQNLSLNFAAIDLILDQESNFWFLEINPNGQWVWIEKILDYPICESIIEFYLDS